MHKHPLFAADLLFPIEFLGPRWIFLLVTTKNGMAPVTRLN